ncbi:MAG: bifunctional DNA primase/polymerase [Kofleriaceae bacterium]|nr:bifunctional DNA primase/polymerase [Kofleriaceae bacterium]
MTSRRSSRGSPDARYQPAIITGPSSNLLVIDIDPRSGGDSSFSALINDLGDPGPTYEVATGGGGRHLYYADPGVDVRHRLPTAPGVDFLGAGRKVHSAAAQKHASGRRYSIVRDMDVSAAAGRVDCGDRQGSASGSTAGWGTPAAQHCGLRDGCADG